MFFFMFKANGSPSVRKCNGCQTERPTRHNATVRLKRGSTSSSTSPGNRTPPRTNVTNITDKNDKTETNKQRPQTNKKETQRTQQQQDKQNRQRNPQHMADPRVASRPTNPAQSTGMPNRRLNMNDETAIDD